MIIQFFGEKVEAFVCVGALGHDAANAQCEAVALTFYLGFDLHDDPPSVCSHDVHPKVNTM